MKSRTVLLGIALIGIAPLGLTACGEGGHGEMDIPAELAARAAITPENARATAMSGYASAELISGELEEEDGALIYSFDLRVPGREGVQEVHVDAQTGRIVSDEHESEEDEAAERGEEEREGAR